MRALEYLVQLYPDKTGKEILEIQVQEKLDDQKEFEETNKKKLAFMKDINENGGYYRGRFGLDQHYYYRVFDMEMDNHGNITMKVDSLVLFYNEKTKNQVTKEGEIRIERRLKEYQHYDNYGLHDCERVTVKEWDAVNKYLDAVNKYLDAMSELFWDKLPK